MKKRILMIAPASYPVTGAEGIVNIKLLQALSRSEKFEIDLISKRDKWQKYESDSIEEFDVKLKSLNVIEVDNKINIRTILQHIWSFILFGVVFKGSHWAVKALIVARQMMKENKYDYILTKNAPSFLIGKYLQKRYTVKWVATWNDPYPVSCYPAPYGKGWDSSKSNTERKIMKIMSSADVHIFPSDRIRSYMLNYLNVPEERTLVLPHVVLDVKDEEITNKVTSKKLHVLHSGNLTYPRSPKNLLKALKKISEEYSEINMDITILGAYDDAVRRDIYEMGLSEYVKTLSPVSYSQSLKFLKDYQIALIVEADCHEGIFLPTKVSDFMQYKMRIFAASPSVGVLNDLYQSRYVQYFAPINNTEQIYIELKKIYEDFQSGAFDHPATNNIPTDYKADHIIEVYFNL